MNSPCLVHTQGISRQEQPVSRQLCHPCKSPFKQISCHSRLGFPQTHGPCWLTIVPFVRTIKFTSRLPTRPVSRWGDTCWAITWKTSGVLSGTKAVLLHRFSATSFIRSAAIFFCSGVQVLDIRSFLFFSVGEGEGRETQSLRGHPSPRLRRGIRTETCGQPSQEE